MFWVYVIGTVVCVLVWAEWMKEHPQERGEWSKSKLFGAWLVFMFWPFAILWIIIVRTIKR